MAKPLHELLTLQDFRDFFAEIPESQWQEGAFVKYEDLRWNYSCRCANGWLTTYDTSRVQGTPWVIESAARERLNELLVFMPQFLSVVNDGLSDCGYVAANPKQRVIEFLDDAIKAVAFNVPNEEDEVKS